LHPVLQELLEAPPWRRDWLGDEEWRLRCLVHEGQGLMRGWISPELLTRLVYCGRPRRLSLHLLDVWENPLNVSPWMAATVLMPYDGASARLALTTTRAWVLGQPDTVTLIGSFSPSTGYSAGPLSLCVNPLHRGEKARIQ